MKEKEDVKGEDKKTLEELKKGSFIDAWVNAFNGIIYATTTQGNIRKQLLIAVVVMIESLLFILAEMFNTAIETVVDLYTDIYHPKAKIAKDVAAGGVVITAVNALIVAYFLFFDKISDIGLNFIRNLANSPVHMAFIGIFLIIILIVTLKAASSTKKHKLLKNGFSPSGQAAMAFGAMTIIWLSTTNIVVLTLSFVMAILVCVTRIESRKKSLSEVIFGALTGISVIALLYGLAGMFLKIF